MTAIFDFIFGWAMRMNVPAYDGTEPALYHEKVKEMVHELNSEEKEALEAYIKQVEGLSAKGLDGRHWPKNDTIENIFLPQLRTVFSKDC
jgi:hypothetical protein